MAVTDLVEEMQRRGTAEIRARMSRPKEAREPKVAKRGHPERDIQRSIVATIRKAVPSVLVAAVPNEQGGTGDANQRARFGAARKASGVLTGHPDLIVYLPGGRCLLWELKAEKGTTSPGQRVVHAQLYDLGHPVEVIRSVEAAIAALARAGVPMGYRMRLAVPVESLSR